MVDNLYFGNEKTARINRINILSILQDRNFYRFKDLEEKTKLYPSVLNKHLKGFVKFGWVKKNKERKEYQITDKGAIEYRKLLTEEKAEKMDLMDFEELKNPPKDFRSVQVLVSGVLTEEKRKAIQKGLNEKLLSTITEAVGDISSSYAITFKINKVTTAKPISRIKSLRKP